jgi:hypothetical protein
MKALLALVLGLGLISFAAQADEKKDEKKAETKKLEGKLCCTKCSLGETKTCGHALKVKDGDKEVTYYLNDKGGKEKYHSKVCTEEKDATVSGKIVEKDGKKHIDEPKVEIK